MEIKYNAQLGIHDPTTRLKNNRANVLPEGPWKVKGRLDKPFHEWAAKKWEVQFKSPDFYRAKADCLSYFCNYPQRLLIRWAEYQDEMRDRFAIAQWRVQAGVPLAEDEKSYLRDHVKAVVGEEINPYAEFGSEELAQLSVEVQNFSPSQLPLLGGGAEEIAEAKPEAPVNPMAGLAGILEKFTMPSSPAKRPQTTVEEINQLLVDPILRAEYQAKVKREFKAYEHLEDADGLICQVLEVVQ